MTSAATGGLTKAQRERREKELTWELSVVEPRVECAVHGRFWQRIESEVREAARAKRMADARLHARHITPICNHCPVADMCKEWASVSRYVGVAGGRLVVHGRALKAS